MTHFCQPPFSRIVLTCITKKKEMDSTCCCCILSFLIKAKLMLTYWQYFFFFFNCVDLAGLSWSSPVYSSGLVFFWRFYAINIILRLILDTLLFFNLCWRVDVLLRVSIANLAAFFGFQFACHVTFVSTNKTVSEVSTIVQKFFITVKFYLKFSGYYHKNFFSNLCFFFFFFFLFLKIKNFV